MSDEVPCKYHPELVAFVAKHGTHLKNLNDNVILLIKNLKDVSETVTKINESLIGTLDKQGLITKFYTADEKNRVAIDELIMWKAKVDEMARALIFKLLGIGASSVIIGAVVAVAIVKYFGGFGF